MLLTPTHGGMGTCLATDCIREDSAGVARDTMLPMLLTAVSTLMSAHALKHQPCCEYRHGTTGETQSAILVHATALVLSR